MNWIHNLCKTYENAIQSKISLSDATLLPICHTTQNAHIEVTLDGNGRFLRARSLSRNERTTIVPCTEASGSRAGIRPACHPLADKLQYLAGDFVDYGGEVTSGFAKNPLEPHESYIALLQAWVQKDTQPKTSSVLKYVKKNRLIQDLVAQKVLPIDQKGKLPKSIDTTLKEGYPLLSVLGGTELPEDSFIRWAVEVQAGDPSTSLSTDEAIWKSWTQFYEGTIVKSGVCYVSGVEDTLLAELHPAKIRNSGDKAKLISSNDMSGFTFRGRFIDADQACSVGFEVTQKAHNALRWLIQRQGFRSGDPAVVSWAVSGKKVPSPLLSTQEMLERALDELGEKVAPSIDDDQQSNAESSEISDSGQTFALRLNKMIAGYSVALGSADGVVVMGLDSATPGRMAITYYRELTGSEFLSRIEEWHRTFAWPLLLTQESADGKQGHVRAKWQICTPAPREVAEVAFGRRITDKLKKATVERLLPCIVDAASMPRDLVDCCAHRASNRAALKHFEWEKALGIACALFKGSHMERSYEMSLEPERRSRDYLYGRLLAIAEHVEERALYLGGEKRDTNAAKLMQRFAERPFSTWRVIEGGLTPYKTRLQSKRPPFLYRMKKLLDEVHALFSEEDFQSDKKLSGEYLLGYHCQRLELQKKAEAVISNGENADDNEDEEKGE
jgi:CRISPR-associated protein Csd1